MQSQQATCVPTVLSKIHACSRHRNRVHACTYVHTSAPSAKLSRDAEMIGSGYGTCLYPC